MENIKNVIKHIVHQYFVIYGCITMLMVFARSSQGLPPVEYKYMFYIMVFSVLGALPSLMLILPQNLSEKAEHLLGILHFVVLETIIVAAAAVIGVVDCMANAIVLFLEVAVIYMIVRLFDWGTDKKTSDQINEGLKKWKEK